MQTEQPQFELPPHSTLVFIGKFEFTNTLNKTREPWAASITWETVQSINTFESPLLRISLVEIWRARFLNVCLAISLLSRLGKGYGPVFEKKTNQKCFVPIKFGWNWPSGSGIISSMYFCYFFIIPPWEKVVTRSIILINLNSLNPRMFCAKFEIDAVVLKNKMKMWRVNRQMEGSKDG